jgi:phenylacetate-CoA ligase
MLQENSAAQLNKLVNYSLKNIPYYKNNYIKSKNIKLDELKFFFSSFPVLDKNTISQNLNTFQNRPKIKGIKKNTGGSTGSPFIFYLERFITREKEKAFMFDQWSRIGYNPGDKLFNLRGTLPEKGKFLKYDKLFNTYNASSLDLSSSNIKTYLDCINQLQPKFLHGYPSTIYLLACLIKDAGLCINYKLKGIFCGSEKLFLYQRRKIEKIFQTRVFGWYGHSEYQILAGECEYSQKLHVYPQYGYTEFIPTGKQHVNGKEIFEIVATGFNNRYMPLLRYRTQDYATLADNQKCKCGRNYTLLDEVIGREQEFILDKNENLLCITPLIYGQHFSEFEEIDAFQIHQNKIGRIKILVKPKNIKIKNTAYHFADSVKKLVGDRFDVEYEIVDQIQKSMIGKSKTVLQELNISDYISIS